MQKSIKKLFTEYEKVFNALEVEELGFRSLQEHFISAGPRGSIAVGRDEFAKRRRATLPNFTEAWGRHPQEFFPWTKLLSATNIQWSKSMESDVQEDWKQAD